MEILSNEDGRLTDCIRKVLRRTEQRGIMCFHNVDDGLGGRNGGNFDVENVFHIEHPPFGLSYCLAGDSIETYFKRVLKSIKDERKYIYSKSIPLDFQSNENAF